MKTPHDQCELMEQDKKHSNESNKNYLSLLTPPVLDNVVRCWTFSDSESNLIFKSHYNEFLIKIQY